MKRNPALDTLKIRIIQTQSKAVRDGSFFLAGGTGLAVRLHHRVSNDLDWFTAERFDTEKLRQALEHAAERPTSIEQQSPQTVRAYYGGLETSFIRFGQVTAPIEEVPVGDGVSVPVATLELLALMKAAAVHDRGTKRDFIDVYAICKQPGWSVGRFIEHAAASLPLQPDQIALALTYFADADRQPMPARCTFSWEQVRKQLTADVMAWRHARSATDR